MIRIQQTLIFVLLGASACMADLDDSTGADDGALASNEDAVALTLAGPTSITANTCSGPFTITRTTTTKKTVTLSGQGTGAFYAAGCGGSSFTSMSMAAKATSAQFYFKDPTAEALTLTSIIGTTKATLAVTVTGTVAPPTTAIRGMWTSDAGASLESAATGSSTRTTFFAQLAAKQINRVIVESSAMLKNNPAALSGFVQDCKSRGIDVEFLINATGSTISASATSLATYAGYAKTYDLAYCPTGAEVTCASGFNVDFEPHVFAEWTSNLAQAETDYLNGLAEIESALSGSRLAFAAATTNWYDSTTYNVNGGSLVSAIFATGVRRMYIMNYTNSQSQMDSRAAGEVAIACGYAGGGKEVISISDAKDEGTTTADQALTFYAQGWTAMNAAWGYLVTQFATQSCFKGNAGFDYSDMIVLGQ